MSTSLPCAAHRTPRAGPESIAVLGHHDVDGVISAAIAGRYLRDRRPDVTFEYGTVDFHLKGVWSECWPRLQRGERVWNPAERRPAPSAFALVDFPLPPAPDDAIVFYADHHPGAFEFGSEGEYRTRVAAGRPCFHRVTGSCADLLLRQLREFDGWEAPASLLHAARLAHVVDTASYATPQEAMRLDGESAPALDLWVSRLTEREAAAAIARLVDGASVHDALVAPHEARYAELVADAADGATQIARFSERLTPDTVLVDTTMTIARPLTRVRFLEYADARVRYAISLSARRQPNGAVLVSGTVGRSPWAPPAPSGVAHPDLGKLTKQFADGGGHPYAAGFRMQGPTVASALLAARVVVSRMLPYLQALPVTHLFADPTHRVTTPLALPAATVTRTAMSVRA